MEYKVDNLIYAAGKDLLNTIRSRLTLTEQVDPAVLRKAVDSAITRYPYFSLKMIRKGEKYVFIDNDAPLPITPGGRAIPLGGQESNGHLMAISYDGNLIYIDTSHFITDGNGIFPFIKTLLYCYLHILHPEEVFDMTGIALPGSNIPEQEATDDPFPKKTVHTIPLGFATWPEKVFMLPHQPRGYESRDRWTSFRIKIKQKNMMRYASSVDGSPATFIASVMYRAISDIHPDHKLPVVCGMQHQYRKALGNPYSHMCHVGIIPIIYSEQMQDKVLELLNTMARGITILRGDDANDLLYVNNHIKNEQKIKCMTLAEKHDYMKKYVLNGIGKNTFEVSYTGRVPFNGLERYVTDFTPILDMSLSGGMSIEIFAVGENFCINIMQRSDYKRYVNRFIAHLEKHGIKCKTEPPEHFEINDFVLP